MIKKINSKLQLQAMSVYLRSFDEPRLSCIDWLRDSTGTLFADQQVDVQALDLIITLSTSIDRIIERNEQQTPRVGYALQEHLQADSAFVIDLQDTTWAQALEVANGYFVAAGMKNILIAEANSHDVKRFPTLEAGARSVLLSASDAVSQCQIVQQEITGYQPNTLSLSTEGNLELSLQLPAKHALTDQLVSQIGQLCKTLQGDGQVVMIDAPHYLEAQLIRALQFNAPQVHWSSWNDTQAQLQEALPQIWLSICPFRAKIVARTMF